MRKRGTEGFSLIEMMIVVIIVALMMAGIGLSIGATSRVQLRSSCLTVMAAVRYAFSRAVTFGTTVRLVIDFDEHSMRLEEAAGRVVLNKSDESGEGLRRSEDEEKEREALEEQRKSFLNLGGGASSGSGASSGGMSSGMGGGLGGLGMLGGGMGDGSSEEFVMDESFYASLQDAYGNTNVFGYKPPSFKPLPGKRGVARVLEGKTIFKRVFTPHEPRAREEGRAYIYFFPNGMGEHAFIQLSDSEDRIYTVETHPLSGKSFFYNEMKEPEEDLDELKDAEE